MTQPTMTSSRLRLRLIPVLRFVAAASLASLGVWILRLTPSTPEDWSGSLLAALQNQPIIAWAALFLTTSVLLQYWLVALAIEPRAQPMEGKPWRHWLPTLAVVAATVAVAFASRAYVVELASVRSTSMLPTLYPGDWVAVKKVGHRAALPARGDLIMLDTPDPHLAQSEPFLFKRVIGLPKDRLSVHAGQPTINGWKVPRCELGRAALPLRTLDAPVEPLLLVEWLGDATYLTMLDGLSASAGPFEVPAGQVYVLGDHRNASVDSRHWAGGKGGLRIDGIRGVAQHGLLNTEGVPARRFIRTEQLALPPGAEHLASALKDCLAKKPSQTLPPEAGKAEPTASKQP
jgi:signal peptidase I